jgi:type IV secretion system protein VirB10
LVRTAIVQALQGGCQESINQSGQQFVRRQINVQPTFTIRPGFPKYT